MLSKSTFPKGWKGEMRSILCIQHECIVTEGRFMKYVCKMMLTNLKKVARNSLKIYSVQKNWSVKDIFRLNPFKVGNTWLMIWACFIHHRKCGTEEIFLHDFQVILKHTLQNYSKIFPRYYHQIQICNHTLVCYQS